MRNFARLLTVGLAALSLVGSNAQAANLAPLQIVDDPAADHPTAVKDQVGPEWMGDTVTPVGAASDLRGVSIAETDDTIDVIWKVTDINELVYPAAPLNTTYYFEFTLATLTSSAQFSLRARLHPVPVSTGNPTGGVSTAYPAGFLQSNCVTTGTLITCTTLPNSVVTVSVDTAAETITASMRRQDLKGPGGAELAVDGAQLSELTVFRGIAACTSAIMVVMAAGCDEGEIEAGVYTLGSERPA